MNVRFKAGMVLVALGTAAAGTGCVAPELLAKGMVGRVGRYDYSPSVIQSGNIKQFWWCARRSTQQNHPRIPTRFFTSRLTRLRVQERGR